MAPARERTQIKHRLDSIIIGFRRMATALAGIERVTYSLLGGVNVAQLRCECSHQLGHCGNAKQELLQSFPCLSPMFFGSREDVFWFGRGRQFSACRALGNWKRDG